MIGGGSAYLPALNVFAQTITLPAATTGGNVKLSCSPAGEAQAQCDHGDQGRCAAHAVAQGPDSHGGMSWRPTRAQLGEPPARPTASGSGALVEQHLSSDEFSSLPSALAIGLGWIRRCAPQARPCTRRGLRRRSKSGQAMRLTHDRAGSTLAVACRQWGYASGVPRSSREEYMPVPCLALNHWGLMLEEIALRGRAARCALSAGAVGSGTAVRRRQRRRPAGLAQARRRVRRHDRSARAQSQPACGARRVGRRVFRAVEPSYGRREDAHWDRRLPTEPSGIGVKAGEPARVLPEAHVQGPRARLMLLIETARGRSAA